MPRFALSVSLFLLLFAVVLSAVPGKATATLFHGSSDLFSAPSVAGFELRGSFDGASPDPSVRTAVEELALVVDLEGTTASWLSLETSVGGGEIITSGIFSPGLGQDPIPIDLTVEFSPGTWSIGQPAITQLDFNPDGTWDFGYWDTIPLLTFDVSGSWILSGPTTTLQGTFSDSFPGSFVDFGGTLDASGFPTEVQLSFSQVLGRVGDYVPLVDTVIDGVSIEVSWYSFFALMEEDVSLVPEPSTALLFATGLAGLAVVGRRRA